MENNGDAAEGIAVWKVLRRLPDDRLVSSGATGEPRVTYREGEPAFPPEGAVARGYGLTCFLDPGRAREFAASGNFNLEVWEARAPYYWAPAVVCRAVTHSINWLAVPSAGTSSGWPKGTVMSPAIRLVRLVPSTPAALALYRAADIRGDRPPNGWTDPVWDAMAYALAKGWQGSLRGLLWQAARGGGTTVDTVNRLMAMRVDKVEGGGYARDLLTGIKALDRMCGDLEWQNALVRLVDDARSVAK
ncbi:MAG: hypothetical protein IT577_15230 [Verrucomicrobiae bacterium]|nr:hypothetical protein [Verrucomicrobiae bacterium]